MAMRTVFDASNAVEAHMILHLLQQSGIDGRVEGEQLLGAVGELPAMGLVRVVVADEDVTRAKAVIADWEIHQRAESSNERPPSRLNPVSILLGMAAGAIVTIFVIWWFQRSQDWTEGVDHDGDGILEERFTYDNGRLILVELDRNSDRQKDSVVEYDADGYARLERADWDLNKSDRLINAEYDSDRDGIFDIEYRYDLFEEIETARRIP
jgi:hypothetical protein